MSHLLDTNVVSELIKRSPDPHAVAWLRGARRRSLYLSVITVGEIRKGIERTRPHDATRAGRLEHWLEALVRSYGERVLPVDQPVAEEWGWMLAADPAHIADTLLAATAAVHGLTLVTRNVRDFDGRGIRLLNPFGPPS